MGFIERLSCLAPRHLTSGNYLHLVLLGTTSRGPISIDQAYEAATILAAPLWTPTHSLVIDTLQDLCEQDLLAVDEPPISLRITASGRRRLSEILSMGIPSPHTPFGQAGIRLKLAFLDHLPPDLRRRQLDGLIQAYECEIAARTSRCRAWHLSGDFGRAWLDQHIEGLEEGLTVLRRLSVA
ncbi:conserved hypothetical protein [Candidatus Terasakiella magnetica]|nr:conserved hypothetical protein [Candidatus Terasakiella magnetica]